MVEQVDSTSSDAPHILHRLMVKEMAYQAQGKILIWFFMNITQSEIFSSVDII